MTFKEMLESIQNEFERRFGVAAGVKIYLHHMAKTKEPLTRELAEHIANEFAVEISSEKLRHDAYEKGGHRAAWVKTSRFTPQSELELIAFYPYSEYHQVTIKDNNTHISDAYAKTN